MPRLTEGIKQKVATQHQKKQTAPSGFERFIRTGRAWSLFLLATFILGSAWTWFSRLPPAAVVSGAPPPSPREGFSAPDFTLEVLGGGEMTLSELHGLVVLVNLWASWCPPCRAEMPTIERVYQDLKAQGLVVLAINTTYQDAEDAAASFVAEHSLTFPIALDRTGAVANRYQLRGLPSTFFIDRQGVIREVVVGGPMAESLIRSKVQDLLAEEP